MIEPQNTRAGWRRLVRRVLQGFSYGGLSNRSEVTLSQWIDHGHYCARQAQLKPTGPEGDKNGRA